MRAGFLLEPERCFVRCGVHRAVILTHVGISLFFVPASSAQRQGDPGFR